MTFILPTKVPSYTLPTNISPLYHLYPSAMTTPFAYATHTTDIYTSAKNMDSRSTTVDAAIYDLMLSDIEDRIVYTNSKDTIHTVTLKDVDHMLAHMDESPTTNICIKVLTAGVMLALLTDISGLLERYDGAILVTVHADEHLSPLVDVLCDTMPDMDNITIQTNVLPLDNTVLFTVGSPHTPSKISPLTPGVITHDVTIDEDGGVIDTITVASLVPTMFRVITS